MKLPDILLRVTPLSKYLAMFFFIFFPFLAFWGGINYQRLITPDETTIVKPPDMDFEQPVTREMLLERDKKDMLENFLLYYLPQFPNFQAKFKPESILQVYSIGGINIYDHVDGGKWLIEVQKDTGIISHYLLTPELEKELVNSMSCVLSQDTNPPIKLDKVQVIGNERGLGRKLLEKSGYIILSGTENECYGGANSGFVSVYNARTGDKIKLQGDYDTGGRFVSDTGNALGILKGIYGVFNPQIVIEYGNFESAASVVEQVNTVAYFDLQTGKLKQLVNFK